MFLFIFLILLFGMGFIVAASIMATIAAYDKWDKEPYTKLQHLHRKYFSYCFKFGEWLAETNEVEK